MTAAARRLRPAEEVSKEISSPADTLRHLAGRVRRLSIVGRYDVEASFVERDELARALCRIAREIER